MELHNSDSYDSAVLKKIFWKASWEVSGLFTYVCTCFLTLWIFTFLLCNAATVYNFVKNPTASDG